MQPSEASKWLFSRREFLRHRWEGLIKTLRIPFDVFLWAVIELDTLSDAVHTTRGRYPNHLETENSFLTLCFRHQSSPAGQSILFFFRTFVHHMFVALVLDILNGRRSGQGTNRNLSKFSLLVPKKKRRYSDMRDGCQERESITKLRHIHREQSKEHLTYTYTRGDNSFFNQPNQAKPSQLIFIPQRHSPWIKELLFRQIPRPSLYLFRIGYPKWCVDMNRSCFPLGVWHYSRFFCPLIAIRIAANNSNPNSKIFKLTCHPHRICSLGRGFSKIWRFDHGSNESDGIKNGWSRAK